MPYNMNNTALDDIIMKLSSASKFKNKRNTGLVKQGIRFLQIQKKIRNS